MSESQVMKHVQELVSDYIDAHPEEFERGSVGVLVPDGTDERVVARWLDDSQGIGLWSAGLRGAFKEDACGYARGVLSIFSTNADEVTTARILDCVNAFADWEKNLTRGPEVVLSYCSWMRHELTKRWREPLTCWPWVAVNLMLCELSIRSFHRLDVKDAETDLAMLIINAAHFFEVPQPTQQADRPEGEPATSLN